MKKKTLTEKILFTITIILGLSVVIGSIVTGCYYIHLEDWCGENCNHCVPIVIYGFFLFVTIIVYATQHGRIDKDEMFIGGLYRKFGESNGWVVFLCSFGSLVFLRELLLIFMLDIIIFEIVVWCFLLGIGAFIGISDDYFEKIKKMIINTKIAGVNIRQERVIKEQNQKTNEVKFRKKTQTEKILFTITIVLGLSVILGSIGSGCYYLRLGDVCSENCRHCAFIMLTIFFLWMATITYATRYGRENYSSYLQKIQEKLGNNNALTVFICFIASMYFFAEFLVMFVFNNISLRLIFVGLAAIGLIIFVTYFHFAAKKNKK